MKYSVWHKQYRSYVEYDDETGTFFDPFLKKNLKVSFKPISYQLTIDKRNWIVQYNPLTGKEFRRIAL